MRGCDHFEFTDDKISRKDSFCRVASTEMVAV